MQVFFNEILAQLKGIWQRLDPGQRLVVSAVMVATLVGLGAVVWFASQPSYETVFTARTPEQIAQFQEAMQKAGVSWRPGADGTFQVERSQVAKAYMATRESGLQGGTAPAIGGSASLIEDAETKAWRLDAATRSQAASAIGAIDGVVAVTVTGSRPRQTAAFRDRDNEVRASATVVLRLKPGVSFETIARSAASVASSQLMVPLGNIDVVSATGGQRWRFDPDRDAGGGSSEFLNLQRSLSDERTRMAQDRLDQLWPGKTSVSVAIELDPSWEIRNEKVVPKDQLVKSEKVSKDNSETPGRPGDSGDAAKGGTSRNETKDREFVTEIGELRTGRMAPEIKRMSVALLYDRSLDSAAGFSKDDLVKAVKAIVGWNPQRDTAEAFSTLAAEFAPIENLPPETGAPGIADLALRWGPTIGQALGVIVVVLFLRGLFRRSSKAASAASSATVGLTQITPEEENLSPEEQQKRMRREIERSIATDPAALAKLLEAWLVEQKA
ncbi:MAG: hypothetical protein JNK78_16000 [Planctomycetes bacterium]|nr:hypothetical protein [Planctomycetota bacterium]